MKLTFTTIVLVATAVAAMPTPSLAQEFDIGKREYDNNCAVCHGVGGKGDGPLAGLIGQPLPDLSQLQKNNDGVFPFADLYQVIDGREMVEWHGSRDMPVWGKEYSATAPEELGFDYGLPAVEAFVRGRILALLGHIYTLQEQ